MPCLFYNYNKNFWFWTSCRVSDSAESLHFT